MQKKNKGNIEKSASPPKFYLEIEGDRILKCYLSGALGLREFDESRIGILLKNGAVNIEGKGLKLSVYDNNCLEISGNITDISLKYKSKSGSRFYAD